MKTSQLIRTAIAACLATAALGAMAQSARPYREGAVTEVSSIRTKDGHFEDYMKFLDTQYKPLMEAYKKAGLILDYHVYGASPRAPGEPDLFLAITYANMAALDRIEETIKVSETALGSMAQQEKAQADRGVIRDVLGSQLIRELVLK